jgi:O-Antigen ligase
MRAFSALPPFPLTKTQISSAAAWTLVILVAVAVCSRIAISHYGVAAIEGIVAVPVFVVIAQRPLLGVGLLLALMCSVFSYSFLPRLNMPGHPPINLGDVCLAALVGGTLWRKPWRAWPRAVQRYFLALMMFLVVAAVATVKTSLVGYVESRNALSEYRNWLYLGTALTIALELRGKSWRPLLDVAVAVAAVVACLSIAAAASHAIASFLATLSPAQDTVVQEAVGTVSAARVRVVGLFFVYAMCIPTLVMALVVKDRWRVCRIFAFALMLAAIAVSLNRNMYFGLLVALLITVLLGGTMLRRRVVVVFSIATTVLALAILTSAVPGITSTVAQRAGTALSPSGVVQSGSLQDRAYELRFAVPEIGRHPWFGVGPNQFYGAWLGTSDGQLISRFFVQNLYVYIATDYGIPAALAFILMPGICLWFGVARLSYASTSLERALLASFIGTLAALMLSLLVGTYVQSPESTVAFAVLCGLLLAAALRTFRPNPSSDRLEHAQTT